MMSKVAACAVMAFAGLTLHGCGGDACKDVTYDATTGVPTGTPAKECLTCISDYTAANPVATDLDATKLATAGITLLKDGAKDCGATEKAAAAATPAAGADADATPAN